MAKTEVSEPQLSVTAFSQRCKSLSIEFGRVIGLMTGDVAFAPEISNASATMILAGRASEVIARNKGGQHPVVPLVALSDDVFIWTGYREVWQKQGSEQSLRFVEGGFTLHLGRQGEIMKPQILRSEWVGRRSRAFVDKAGHPHWQFDVLESTRSISPTSFVRFGEVGAMPPATEFESGVTSNSEADLLTALTVENMHFASAAIWWGLRETSVAHVPEKVADVDRWILGV